MAFNTIDRVHRGMTYRFVIKGKVTISDDEFEDYFKDIDKKLGAVGPSFRIPDGLRNVFSMDIKQGIDFCCQKYGCQPSQVREEVKRLFPQLKADVLK